MFSTLKNKLSNNKKLEGKYQTLAEGIKDYNFGLKHKEFELCYAGCTKVYRILKMSNHLGDKLLKEKIKGMMKEIGNEYFPENANSFALNLPL